MAKGTKMRRLLWMVVVAVLGSPQAMADMAAVRAHMRAGDHEAAAAELERLAKAGDTEAQASLAELYFVGRGVGRDQNAAIDWFRRAAEGGHVAAQVHLGMIQAQMQDFEQSARWFEKAAEQGDAEGMTNLAILYFRGLGVEQDRARGFDWLTKAAVQGDPANQLQLGMLYMDGAGGEPDVDNGLKWIRRAAEQGFVEAEVRLGAMHAAGEGVAKDPVRAYMWYYRAAMLGTEQVAGQLTELARGMTAEQIAKAKRLADAWRPGK